MEDVFKFLLVAAFIIIGLARQFKKETGGNAGENPGTPVPDADEHPGTPAPDGGLSLPGHRRDNTYRHPEDSTYGGYIPESPPPVKKPEPAHRSYAPPKNKRACGKASPPPSASLPQEPDEATSEYGIHSAEEARRAIIWSEILQRKY